MADEGDASSCDTWGLEAGGLFVQQWLTKVGCRLLSFLGLQTGGICVNSRAGWLSGGHAGQRSLFFGDRWAVMHFYSLQ